MSNFVTRLVCCKPNFVLMGRYICVAGLVVAVSLVWFVTGLTGNIDFMAKTVQMMSNFSQGLLHTFNTYLPAHLTS